MDRINLMQSALMVAETGSFTEAADRLGISNRQISKHVAQLEEQLGVRLFLRTTRQVNVTDIGQSFLQKADTLVAAHNELWQSTKNQSSEVAGNLRISAPLSFGEMVVSPLLAALLKDHPKLNIQLDLTDRYINLVEEGYDAAIRIGVLSDSSLVAKKLGKTGLTLVAAPSFLQGVEVPKSPEDIEALPAIVDRNYRERFRWPFVIDGETKRIAVKPRIEVNSPTAARRLALEGLGVTMSPRFVVKEQIENGELVELLPQFMPQTLGIYLVYPAQRFMHSKLHALRDHFTKNIAKAI